MTREEAIRILSQYDVSAIQFYETDGSEISWNKGHKALDMAIKALEQPEIIHCRECKHWCEGDAYSYCNKLFNMGVLDVYDYMTAEDDFCSNAERREE